MNQVFAGATALIVALLLWGFGKKPQGKMIAKLNEKRLESLNQQPISLVEIKSNALNQKNLGGNNLEIDWQAPKTIQERINLEKKLKQLIAGSPEERLKAVKLSDKWGYKAVLPILRKGLRDSDCRVIAAAAAAIEKHRGVPQSTMNQEEATLRPPRNVSRMR